MTEHKECKARHPEDPSIRCTMPKGHLMVLKATGESGVWDHANPGQDAWWWGKHKKPKRCQEVYGTKRCTLDRDHARVTVDGQVFDHAYVPSTRRGDLRTTMLWQEKQPSQVYWTSSPIALMPPVCGAVYPAMMGITCDQYQGHGRIAFNGKMYEHANLALTMHWPVHDTVAEEPEPEILEYTAIFALGQPPEDDVDAEEMDQSEALRTPEPCGAEHPEHLGKVSCTKPKGHGTLIVDDREVYSHACEDEPGTLYWGTGQGDWWEPNPCYERKHWVGERIVNAQQDEPGETLISAQKVLSLIEDEMAYAWRTPGLVLDVLHARVEDMIKAADRG